MSITTEEAIRDIFGIEEDEVIDDSDYEFNNKIKNDFKKRRKYNNEELKIIFKDLYEKIDNMSDEELNKYLKEKRKLKTIIPRHTFNNPFFVKETEKYENYRYRWSENGGSERVPFITTRKIIENNT